MALLWRPKIVPVDNPLTLLRFPWIIDRLFVEVSVGCVNSPMVRNHHRNWGYDSNMAYHHDHLTSYTSIYTIVIQI